MTDAPISENEGRIVQCGPHAFRIINGVRVWLSPIPHEHLRDIVPNPYHSDHESPEDRWRRIRDWAQSQLRQP